jgi:orotate phosphoribosyltransferase
VSSTANLTFRPFVGDPQHLAEFLGREGVLRHGHFRLLSGLHTKQFLAFSQIAQDCHAVREIAENLAAVCAPWDPTMVLAPSTAGVALGGELARALQAPLHLASLDETGRANGVLGSPDLAGARALLVNDVITTGDGLVALRDVAVDAGAEIVGAACFGTRTNVDVAKRLGIPICLSVGLNLPAFHSSECPMCADGSEPLDALDIN